MLKDKYVFAQLVKFLDNDKFRHIVDKYDGDKYVKSYTCWNQLLTMMFGQLSNRESLRDLIVALEAHAGKVYHLGIGKSVTRSNLSKANEQRDYRIFEEFAFFMIAEARKRRIQKIFELDGHVYAFDSAPAHQETLGHLRECRPHPNLLCHNYLLPCGNCAARYETGAKHL